MKEATKVYRFGTIIPISGVDFVCEVSQAESDVWVAVFLYKEGYWNYPDWNLPTLLVYNNGAIKATYVGMHHFGRRCTPEDDSFLEVVYRMYWLCYHNHTYKKTQNLLNLEKRLLELNSGDVHVVKSVIQEFSSDVSPDDRSILHKQAIIDKCFSKESVKDIIQSFGNWNYFAAARLGLLGKSYRNL
ncbi:hypothetical protein IFM89_032407 [Coptis chinensis]|uniref:Enoyl-CoA hydratase/isomerase domain-containing protein n=1 Tax=Coptis chinensis TaxID=261450 RepID=A0A835J3B9_9MAGN|nr:hypothetical protein IFM89_032407 [Coptis chinensis]